MALNATNLDPSRLLEIGLIAIIRADFDADIASAASALFDGGFRAVEVTLNTPGALQSISALCEQCSSEMTVGAGTILCANDARSARDAGAEFIVTPTLQLETIRFCREQSLPILCGCMTPTEALTAHQAGADFIKLFPANVLGPTYVSSLLAPLPFLKIMPTGGVTQHNLADYIRAGSVGAAIGSNLVSSSRLRSRDWAGIRETAKQYIQAFSAAQSAMKGEIIK
jgi:2-dehydro-3-deoxyphosphogluconate aldolase/(4S)-4-hydroxy-2-oxoglutarate aldolase